jgi:hypothetical protein
MNEQQLTEWIKGKSFLQIKQKIEDIKCMHEGARDRFYWCNYYGSVDLAIMWSERLPVYDKSLKFLGVGNI